MDLPNALPEAEQALPTGTCIGQGAIVSVVDALLRLHAGKSPAECLDWRVDLHATIVPPSTEQAAAIARAQAAFPGVRLHAIQLCSYIRKGEQKNVQPICYRFVAESSCFFDDGPECLEEDPTAEFEVN
jgi:hypothetical protein